ncbi:MAG: squalene/phytoene synthase family protein [Deltaproteobacteria bacterium]|nr:squalene/phytoene synthase family protein [Deltaproteobacteria bacterium]
MNEALERCREILARSGSSFATAFRILPAEQRDALTAFYAFCRAVDDDVDESTDPAEAARRIDAWRRRIDRLDEAGPGEPVAACLGWAAERFGLERRHLHLVLDGVETDLRPIRFETFGQLYDYCYRVASAVGLVCVRVLAGPEAGRAETYAELTGIAVQLTNVLRDVGEDSRKGRIYLPLEDLRAFGVPETDILFRLRTPQVERLLRFQARRAADYYELAGAALPPDLRPRLFFAETLRVTYRRLLERIEADGLPVLERRVAVPLLERVAIALRHRLDPRTLAA